MEKLPKLRDGYHYRVVVVLSGVPYLAICSKKVKGILKKRVVRVIESKVPITIRSSDAGMDREILSTANAMKAVTPRFFPHDTDKSTIDQLNIGLEEG